MEQIRDFIASNELGFKHDEFPPKYYCKICRKVMVKAKSTKCGHRFCERCITKHLVRTKKCPLCVTLLNIENADDVANDLPFDSKINKLLMTCPKGSCKLKVPIGKLGQHLNECTNTKFECTLAPIGCKTEVKSYLEANLHLCNDLTKHFSVLVGNLVGLRAEYQSQIEKLNESISGLTKENVRLTEGAVQIEEEMREINAENSEMKKENDNLKRILEKMKSQEEEVMINDKINDYKWAIELVDFRMKEMSLDIQTRTKIVKATKMAPHEIELSGRFTVSAQHKFNFTEMEEAMKDGRFYHSDKFYLNNYHFEMEMMLSGDALVFTVHLLPGDFDEELLWPLRRSMRLIFIDSNDSDRIVYEYRFSYETENDDGKQNYGKPAHNDYWSSTLCVIDKAWQAVATNDCVIFNMEME